MNRIESRRSRRSFQPWARTVSAARSESTGLIGSPGRHARVGGPRFVLTRRERQIVALVLEGCSNKGIARRLHVKEQTVKNALSIVYEKCGVKTRLALALYAVKYRDQIS